MDTLDSRPVEEVKPGDMIEVERLARYDKVTTITPPDPADTSERKFYRFDLRGGGHISILQGLRANVVVRQRQP